jgi:hypothetical protein
MVMLVFQSTGILEDLNICCINTVVSCHSLGPPYFIISLVMLSSPGDLRFFSL